MTKTSPPSSALTSFWTIGWAKAAPATSPICRRGRNAGKPFADRPSTAITRSAWCMSKDPRDGVVNADCRLHDVANLYVAGSAVFPTGGQANPMLPAVALALRLSAHLAQTRRA
ncbi:hypothetical protein CO661_18255 [Sinorhizobium fredii]|uniref:Glucose-methanol-choline oxidoreductase C-terminal domain-containing protein n=2 Tax=Rhizobium fredii TaxID=380 RepID=A0A2A6LW49_RHIFR|nr:hypothetical protein CO661_18255 [Sinorhizobium fredii]